MKIERRSRGRNLLTSNARRRRGSDVQATSSQTSGNWMAVPTVAEITAFQSSCWRDSRRISAIFTLAVHNTENRVSGGIAVF